MPTQEIISVGFDYRRTEGDKAKVVAALKEVREAYLSLDGLQFQGNGLASFLKNEQELTKIQEQLNKVTNDYVKLQKELNDSLDKRKPKTEKILTEEEKIAKSQLDQIKNTQEQTKYQDTLGKQREKEQKQAMQAANLYLQLNKTLADQRIAYTNAAIAQGENSKAAQDALKTYTATRQTLDKLDTNLRDYRRNVGNYKSAFDGLGLSFTQIARELPSLTQSTQQFFLAISNNLPYAVEEIGKARAEIAAANAAGEATQSLGSRIAGALTSFNVITGISIALLTAFGPKISAYVSGLFNSADAAEKARQKQIEYNKALQQTLDDLDQLQKSRIRLGDYSTENIQNEIDLLRAQGASTETLNIKEQELQDKRSARIKRQLQDQALVRLIPGRENEQRFQSTDVSVNDYEQAARTLLQRQEFFTNQQAGLRDQLNADISDSDKERIKKQIEDNETELNNSKKNYSKIQDVVFAYYNAINGARQKDAESQRTLAENIKQFSDEQRQYALENLQNRLEDEIYYSEKFAEAEKLGALTQLAEARKAASERAELLNATAAAERDRIVSDAGFKKRFDQLQADELLRLNADTAAEIRNINQKLSTDLARNAEKESNQIIKIKADEKKRLEDLAKIQPVETVGNLQRADRSNERLMQVGTEQRKLAEFNASIGKANAKSDADDRALRYTQENTALLKQYNAGRKTKEEYERDKRDLEIKYSKESLDAAIAFSEAELKLLNKETPAYKALAQSIEDAKLARESLAKKTKDNNLADIAEDLQKIANVTQNLTAALSDINNIRYDNQKAELDEIEARQERNYKNEVDRINNLSVSDTDRAALLVKLDATRNSQRIINEQKQREADNKKAQFDKQLSILNIITGTAAAVVKALPNIPLAVSVGILGAAQLVSAVATKVPQYKDGLFSDKPAHYGQYGEAGAEEIRKPGFAPFIATAPTIDWLPTGTRIIPLTGRDISQKVNYVMSTRKEAATEKKQPDMYGYHATRIVKAIQKQKPSRMPSARDMAMAMQYEIYKMKCRGR